MRASVRWLAELSGVDVGGAEMAERLTRAGIEVERVHVRGRLENIVIAYVRAVRPHPARQRLSVVEVYDGTSSHTVVCGAPNVPPPGGRVVLARPGARLPSGLVIEVRDIGGVRSEGMLCSESELDLGPDADGIIVIGGVGGPNPGTAASDALWVETEVLELSVTPNRPDALGHVGLARELAVAFGVPFRPPRPEPPPPCEALPAEDGRHWHVRIEAPERCARYAAALVPNVRVGPSVDWLRYRLHALGMRPISNVVDATNLVLLEWGHPIHAFDADRLEGDGVVVRRARPGESLVTLDGVQRTLCDDDLVIADGARPVALAGVMGGQDSGVTASTRHVLLEVAWFDPRSIRRTARRHALHTEASHRFERGVDRTAVPVVLARALERLTAMASGRPVPSWIDAHPRPEPSRRIVLRPSRARRLLGLDLDTGGMRDRLEALGCTVQPAPVTAEEERLEVTAPGWRPDLQREVDLVEELARVEGYDRIPSSVPAVRPSALGSPPRVRVERRLLEAAAGVGLLEAIHLSFVSRRDLERCRLAVPAVELANPLGEEQSLLRPSLLPGLVGAAARAARRQVESVAFFELGRTFRPAAERSGAPVERAILALLLHGRRGAWIGPGDPVDFHDAAGRLQAIVETAVGARLELRLAEDAEHEVPFLHPRRAAGAWLDGSRVGWAGELHPDLLREWELGAAAYAELDVEELVRWAERRGTSRATIPPRTPAVRRDVALLVAESVQAGQLARALREAAGPLCESVEPFDLFRDERMGADRKSLAFRLTYRHPEQTLTDLEVDAVHARAVQAVVQAYGAVVR